MSPNIIRQVHQVFRRNWPTVEARVNSCSWVHDHDYTGVHVGHYDVTISYKLVNSNQIGRTDEQDQLQQDQIQQDQLQQGHFRRSGNPQIAPYHPGERISIRYSLKHPNRFHLAGASEDYEKLEAILVMALFALIAGYLLFTF